MTIDEQIKEVVDLHDRYSVVRYPDQSSCSPMELLDMFNTWHSKAAILFSRYLSNDDENLVKFKNIEKGNSYVNADLFDDIETFFQILIDKLHYSVAYQLESLIQEGNEIVKTISYVKAPSGIIRMFDVYNVEDETRYQTWKSKSIRFLNVNFKDDTESTAFVEAANSFDKSHYTPKYLKEMVGILISFKEIPNNIKRKENVKQTPPSAVTVNINQSQTQNQKINLFIEAISDELTGKQYKELQSIAQEESNPDTLKQKIVEKLKSFGGDVLSNIVANIITNPSVWNSML
ncbi:hypothetical protein [Prevotella sp.]|uniref:hypothetical protein n=1 Tax=Prevotella sp. TaxID=59823 RepID=UPI002ABDC7C0|nr:hypothetical protein [Prevotella sp.]